MTPNKVCEHCQHQYVPDTKRPHRIARQRFCSLSCATSFRYRDRLKIEMPPPKKRGRRNEIAVGLFEAEALNIQRRRKLSRESYWRNHEKQLARAKSERRRAQRRAWYAVNKDKVQESTRKWRHKNADKIRADARLRKRDKEKRKRYALWWHYGVTLEWYQETLEKQGYACAICRYTLEGKPCVDHDHQTHSVRGILCHRCNKALGMLRDDPAILASAMEYLWRHTGCRAVS